MTCGSVWACPVCASKIAAHRAAELGDVLGWARSEGHTLAMLTFTVRHNRGQRLSEVWDAVASGWSSVTSGSQWKSETETAYAARLLDWNERGRQADADKAAGIKVSDGAQRAPKGWNSGVAPVRRIGEEESFGVLGWVRAAEVTHGRNGWHVHVHVVMVFDGEASEGHVNKLGHRMFERWEKGIGKLGFDALRDSGGLVASYSRGAEKRLAEYVAKGIDAEKVVRASVEKAGREIAKEATLGHGKKGRLNSRSPFQILADTEHGEERDIALWSEWVEGSFGRRQLTWSQELRERAKLMEEEKADEEIASAEIGTEDDTLVWLPWETWKSVRSKSWQLLDLAEKGGRRAVVKFLDSKELGYFLVPPQEEAPPRAA